jgi:hypothetical protein
MIQALYHEIRHQWQKIHNPILYNKYNNNDKYRQNTDYEKQWGELDAEGFSNYMMNLNYKSIYNITKTK